MPRHFTVTDEGSPLSAGLTSVACTSAISVRGAGVPSPPSEEGGGCLHKGLEQADGGRDTVSMRESTWYRQEKRQMTAFSLIARLHLGANSRRALSLPQSFAAAERRITHGSRDSHSMRLGATHGSRVCAQFTLQRHRGSHSAAPFTKHPV